MKELTSHIPDLIALLEDPAATVPPAARAALQSLTSQDFGPVADAWRTWWKKQGGQ